MFTLIIGGAASGKSAYAEFLVNGLDGQRVYLAAMEPFGEEAMARIKRHRALRSQKGFVTVERTVDIGNAPLPENGNVLLEDLGNLTANELFSPEGAGPERIVSGVLALSARVRHLTVVTNEVFSGGSDYAGDTWRYLTVLGDANCRLAARAERVIEVVCGIPCVVKGANDADI